MFVSYDFHSQSGDSCDEAILITAGSYNVNGINGESYGANCTEYDAANGDLQWYSYVPSQDFLVTVSTDYAVNNGLDTRFHVYGGSCESLQCVGGDDDSGDGYLSHGTFYAYTGNTYFIAWDDRWGTEDFEFTLTLRKRKNSFHLNLSRGSKMPLKIHLGTRDKLIDRLTPLFPKENVKRNWYFIIKREIRFYFDPKKKRYVDGMIYEKVLDRIMKNPTGFHAETFNLENLLPPV